MEIKDIVKQEKQKEAVLRMKKKQEKYTRKAFLKDCYKFWKEYKTVEKPYTWWFVFFTFDYLIFGKAEFFRLIRFDLPKEYSEFGWFNDKWEYEYVACIGYKFKRKNQPNQPYTWIKY